MDVEWAMLSLGCDLATGLASGLYGLGRPGGARRMHLCCVEHHGRWAPQWSYRQGYGRVGGQRYRLGGEGDLDVFHLGTSGGDLWWDGGQSLTIALSIGLLRC